MVSTVEKQLQKIKQLIIHGEFQEALSFLRKIKKNKEITKEEELISKTMKSDTIHKLGRHQEALQIVEEVLKESKGLDFPLIQLDALLIKAEAYDMSDHVVDKIISVLESAKKIMSSIKNIPETVIAEREAKLLQREAQLSAERLRDYAKGIKLHEQGLEFAKKSGNKQLITRSLIYLGVYYEEADIDKKKARKLLDEAENLANSIGNKLELALIHFMYGILNFRNRELKKAIDSYENCIRLNKEIGSTYWLHAYSHLGRVNMNLGELDIALDYHQLNLELQIKNDLRIPATYTSIGYVYSLKNELDKALENYMRALELAEEEKNVGALTYALGSIVELFVEMNNLELAQKYLERLGKIRRETNLEDANMWFLYTSILILKASTKMTDWIKAMESIEELLALKTLSPWFRYVTMFFLVEIRFKELQLTADPAVLEEVKNELINLQNEAEEKQLYQVLVNTYRLQSQLALIELNAEEAITLLSNAYNLATERNLKRLIPQILKEQEKLNSQVSMWEKLKKENAPLVETLKQVPLEDNLKQITKETSIEIRAEKSGESIEYRKLFALKI